MNWHELGREIVFVAAVIVALGSIGAAFHRWIGKPVWRAWKRIDTFIDDNALVSRTVHDQLLTNNGGSTLKDKIEATQREVSEVRSEMQSLTQRLDQLDDDEAAGHLWTRRTKGDTL